MGKNQKDKAIISRIRQLLEKADLMEQSFRERVFKNAVSEYMEIKNKLNTGQEAANKKNCSSLSSANESSQAEEG